MAAADMATETKVSLVITINDLDGSIIQFKKPVGILQQTGVEDVSVPDILNTHAWEAIANRLRAKSREPNFTMTVQSYQGSEIKVVASVQDAEQPRQITWTLNVLFDNNFMPSFTMIYKKAKMHEHLIEINIKSIVQKSVLERAKKFGMSTMVGDIIVDMNEVSVRRGDINVFVGEIMAVIPSDTYHNLFIMYPSTDEQGVSKNDCWREKVQIEAGMTRRDAVERVQEVIRSFKKRFTFSDHDHTTEYGDLYLVKVNIYKASNDVKPDQPSAKPIVFRPPTPIPAAAAASADAAAPVEVARPVNVEAIIADLGPSQNTIVLICERETPPHQVDLPEKPSFGSEGSFGSFGSFKTAVDTDSWSDIYGQHFVVPRRFEPSNEEKMEIEETYGHRYEHGHGHWYGTRSRTRARAVGLPESEDPWFTGPLRPDRSTYHDHLDTPPDSSPPKDFDIYSMSEEPDLR